MDATTGVMPVYNMSEGQGGGMMGNTWIWVFFLFFLLAWGGNGGGLFGGNGGGQSVAMNGVDNDFMYTNLSNAIQNGFGRVEQSINGVDRDLLSQTNTIQQTLCSGFGGVMNGLNVLGYQNQQGVSAIIQNATANSQRILDKLCQMESSAKDETIYELRTNLQASQLQLGNVAQTQNIVNQLKPVPVPAYLTCSPYVSAGFCPCNS